MKKNKIISISVVSLLIIISLFNMNLSYSKETHSNNQININMNDLKKEYFYNIIKENKIDYNNQDLTNILLNWYDYFNIEDMFLTSDGEYIDYTTYQIYNIHLKNTYNDDEKKILKKLLKYTNFPKQENSALYDKYIEEYINTTGKEI